MPELAAKGNASRLEGLSKTSAWPIRKSLANSAVFRLCTSSVRSARRLICSATDSFCQNWRGDLFAVLQSGAYGLTASPTAFLSQPRPAEILVVGGKRNPAGVSRRGESNQPENEKRRMAPRVGFEPTTNRLTAGCSTTELPRNSSCAPRRGAGLYQVRRQGERPGFIPSKENEGPFRGPRRRWVWWGVSKGRQGEDRMNK